MDLNMRQLLLSVLSISLFAGSPKTYTWHKFGHDSLVAYLESADNKQNSDWINTLRKQVLKKTPARINEWNLVESQFEFSPKSNTIWKHDIYGLRARFVYSSQDKNIIIYHFFNPVHIKYPEIGIGYSVGFSTFQFVGEFIHSDDTWKVYRNASWLALNSPSIHDHDRDMFNQVDMEKYCCYGGKNWTINQSNSMYHLGLSFQKTNWKSSVYGELCILSLPKCIESKPFVLNYLSLTK